MLIKNTIQDQRDDLPKKLKQFQTIGSFEDFVSRRYKTLVISHCKTSKIDSAGALFSQAMIDFIMSRVSRTEKDAQVIVIGKKTAMNQVWRTTFAGKGAEIVER